MRVARLDLLRYGHFTDRQLVLPTGASDLHVVFGANEAGKSTARNAIHDFLFGFPTRTSLDFKHAYADLRIGAQLAYAGGELDAIRKKGRKNTLLDHEGNASSPLEAELERALAGADASFFTRMFSLDHQGLREGGRALAAADANAESAMLSAGSGLSGVLGLHKTLNDEALALWSPNAAQNRRYYQAATRLKDAEAAIREYEVTVHDWQRLRDALQVAETSYRDLGDRRRALTQQRHELERIRRVTQPVRRYQAIRDELDTLGELPSLPADARATFEAAHKTDNEAGLAIRQLEELVAQLEDELAAIDADPALVAECDAIERLAEQRPRLADDRERQTEIDTQLGALSRALVADRAQLELADSHADWPSATTLATARRLIGDYSTRAQALAHAETNLADTQERDARLAAEHAAHGVPIDTSALEAWLATQARESDLEAQRRQARTERERLARDIERRRTTLDPVVADVDTLAGLPVPDIADVDDMAQRMANADDQWARRQERVDGLTDEVEHARVSHEYQHAADALPSVEALTQLRQRRDACWTRVRRRYIDRQPTDLIDQIGDDDLDPIADRDPATAFATLLHDSDQLADQRFDRAEAITRQAERAKALAEREHALTQAGARRDQAQTARDDLAADWTARWQPSGLEPRSPAAMRQWLIRRQEILDLGHEQTQADARASELTQRIDAYRSDVTRHLEALGVNHAALAEQSLAVLVERARQAADTEKQQRTARQRADAERTTLAMQLAAQQQKRDDAASAIETWRAAWADTLIALGLSKDTGLDAGQAAVDRLEGARQRADEQQALTAEQGAIETRRAQFNDRLSEVLAATQQPTAAHDTPEQSSRQLSDTLQQAQSDQRVLDTRQTDLAANRQRIAQYREQQQQAQIELDALIERAGTTDRQQLEATIGQVERRRQLATDEATETAALSDQGDGQPIDALIAAVQASDADALRAQIDALTAQIDDFENDINAARDTRNAAKTAFDAVGGDDRAVRAAADRQNALADMQDSAERYLRVGTAAVLLKWAGQSYSMDRQRPLIERGSTLMNTLTGGSIAGLAGEFDERDELQIVGVRDDASRVWPAGMSEGSRDQLYLSLRVAAIEDYLTRAAALPVIADDLFINFDDQRAAAGLDVLAELAQKTQVVLFTHHQHLRDMAADRLGSRVTTHDL